MSALIDFLKSEPFLIILRLVVYLVIICAFVGAVVLLVLIGFIKRKGA